jgi:hypothetical protein
MATIRICWVPAPGVKFAGLTQGLTPLVDDQATTSLS